MGKCSMGFELGGKERCDKCGSTSNQNCGPWVSTASELIAAGLELRATEFADPASRARFLEILNRFPEAQP